MSTTIVTRTTKGSKLSIAEMDGNFTNLQTTTDNATTAIATETTARTAADLLLAHRQQLILKHKLM